MKVNVGNDEFCPICMEWREYDDEGRCKICHKAIKKIVGHAQKITDEYDLTDFSSEHGEE